MLEDDELLLLTDMLDDKKLLLLIELDDAASVELDETTNAGTDGWGVG